MLSLLDDLHHGGMREAGCGGDIPVRLARLAGSDDRRVQLCGSALPFPGSARHTPKMHLRHAVAVRSHSRASSTVDVLPKYSRVWYVQNQTEGSRMPTTSATYPLVLAG